MLLQDDCLKVMPTLEKHSVDLILCDPPYGTTSIKWDEVIDFEEMWRCYEHVLKPQGIVVLFGSQPFSAQLICSKLDWFRYELIWNKNKCGSPGLAKKRPMKVHENILIFYPRPGGTYNPQMEVGDPYARKSKNPEGYVGRKNDHGYGMKPRKEFENKGTRYPKSILNISRDFSAQQQVHPTQKPVPLMEWLIKTYSNEGDTVLDNCMGSGPVGVASKRLNRDFIGIESNAEYFEIAKDRIVQAT